MSKPKTYALSYRGRREYNQDACTVFKKGDFTFIAVADGMGGHKGGAEASQLVIETCKDEISKAAKEQSDPKELKGVLKNIFSLCQEKIAGKTRENPDLTGMGTTLSCVLLFKDVYVWGNIGDSRVYHFNGSILTQITVDHSFIEEYRREHGENIPAYVMARSNIITRSLSGDNDKADIFPIDKHYEKIKWDEGFLICSDGLIYEKNANDSTWMAKIIQRNPHLENAAKELIGKAYEEGSSDNITVVLYEHMDFERSQVSDFSTREIKVNSNTEKISEKEPGKINSAQKNVGKKILPNKSKRKFLIVLLSMILILLLSYAILYLVTGKFFLLENIVSVKQLFQFAL